MVWSMKMDGLPLPAKQVKITTLQKLLNLEN